MNGFSNAALLPGNGASTDEWREWRLGRLAHYDREAGADPLTSAVWRVAYENFQLDEKGLAGHAALATAAKLVCDNALVERARTIAGALAGQCLDSFTNSFRLAGSVAKAKARLGSGLANDMQDEVAT